MLELSSIIQEKMVNKTQKNSIENNIKQNGKKKTTRKNVNKSKVQSKSVKVRNKQADVKSASPKKTPNIRKILTWTILMGILIGISIFLCTSELFKICHIEITGNTQVSQELVLKLSEIKMGNNIFLLNSSKASNKINENAYIKEVAIKKVLPDKIKIEITEKQKLYMLQLDGNYAYVDKFGEVLEISNTKLDALIILEDYCTSIEDIKTGEILGEEDLERLEDTQKILNGAEKNGIFDKIYSINIKDENNYILNMPSYKKIIYVGNMSNLTTKMLRTKDIIDKTMEKEGKIFVNGNFNKGFDPYFREEPNN